VQGSSAKVPGTGARGRAGTGRRAGVARMAGAGVRASRRRRGHRGHRRRGGCCAGIVAHGYRGARRGHRGGGAGIVAAARASWALAPGRLRGLVERALFLLRARRCDVCRFKIRWKGTLRMRGTPDRVHCARRSAAQRCAALRCAGEDMACADAMSASSRSGAMPRCLRPGPPTGSVCAACGAARCEDVARACAREMSASSRSSGMARCELSRARASARMPPALRAQARTRAVVYGERNVCPFEKCCVCASRDCQCLD
jgi:hypothetical protein